MSRLLKTIYAALTGALGALAAWFLLDVVLQIQPDSTHADALLNGALVGVCIGTFTNAFAGLLEFKVRPVIKGLLVGSLAGLLGGVLGLLAGEVLYQFLGGGALPRILGWAIFGVSIGLADGILAFSMQHLIFSGFGGLLGGLLGGTAFMFMTQISDLPNTSRAVGFALMGASIGLMVGAIPAMLSQAWIKVASTGRNEGKERLMDRKRLSIGADERCDLPLYGDPTVQPRHAEIVQENKQFILRPVGSVNVLVNGQPINHHSLQNEDEFQVGRQRLIFRQKG